LSFKCDTTAVFFNTGYDDPTYSWSYTFTFDKDLAYERIFNAWNSDWNSWQFRSAYCPTVHFLSKSCTANNNLEFSSLRELLINGPNFNQVFFSSDNSYLLLNGTELQPELDEPTSRRVHQVRHSFTEKIREDFRSIRASASASASEAVLNLEGGVRDDVLQTIWKLPEIAQALPKIREALEVLSDIRSEKLSTKTLKSILDIATTTQLQASFQWRPYAELLTKHFADIRGVINASKAGKVTTVGRGRFNFTFPSGEFGRDESKLVTRTKIVLDSSPRGLLAALAGFDAMGVLPKPSNLWDLVPFSFVANWLTGVGKAMRRAEFMSTLGMIPALFVHTYQISSPFTDDELSNFSFVGGQEDPLGMVTYYREISKYAPIPGETRFDFVTPTKAPPLGVVLALLYQLLAR
jgi:hypothetical protein